MLTQIINGKIFTPQGWMEDGSVLMRDGQIIEVTNCDLALIGAELVDARGMFIVPGYVCMHAHGGGGHDFTECTEEAFRKAIKAHQQHGATCIFPTMSSSSFEDIRKGVAICEMLMSEKDSPVVGLHLEGPYLTPKRASDQFGDKLCEPNVEEYTSLVESTHCIKRWDASPEVPGALDFARYLKSKGILVAISYTEAEYPLVKEAYEAGFTHTSHFYNGMPGFHKCREYKYEGTVESVYLVDGMTIELIADGKHLPPTILQLAYKVKGTEKTCLVTDALAYAAADKEAVYDPNIIIEDGVCKTKDHEQLAGSIATMDVLVQNMVKAGVQVENALRMASETPARLMNVYDRKGSLEKGKDADILILDAKLNVRAAWSMGKLIEGTNTLF
ncbi:MAG: N-acetylglucosamine-6-phosphate deacetylase [Bacteroides sp.]|nr:N-acetylglucosamine-6-phosphate deacetylase [Bacteroides sp.]